MKGAKVMQMYRHCRLKRGRAQTLSWLPVEFAKVNHVVRLKDVDGWRVVSVGDVLISEDYLRTHERDYLSQRQASDI
jgi:hypothetical protein